MTTPLNFNFNIAKHDVVEVKGQECRFDQVTGGGLVLLTNLKTGNPVQVADPVSGGLSLPTVSHFLDMMRDRSLVIRREKLPNILRQKEREKERDLADIRAVDPRADTRLEVVRYMDSINAPLSDAAINKGLNELCTPEWIAKHGPRPGASTVRLWMIVRGRPGDRRLRDCFSLSGRTTRARRLHTTVISVQSYHQVDFFTNQGLSMFDCWACACSDIMRVNDGKPTSYGETYPQPETPHPLPSYETFRRGVKKLLSTDTYGAKFGAEAKNSRTRGAGKPLRASRALEIVTGDTWTIPGYFCVDAERGLPLGVAYFTNLQDVHSKVMCAWVLECAPSTTTTIGKLLLHLGSSKTVSPYFGERYPSLAAICGKPGEILFDNALYQIAKTVEDEGADTGIAIRLAGANEPRHKAPHERSYGSLKTYIFDKLPGATFDIKLMREFGYDPAKHKVVTFEELHAIVQLAVDFYNTNEHKGLSGRQPLLVWEQSTARHGVDLIPDLDKVENVIGDVFYDVVLSKDGVTVWGMRFGGAEAVPDLLDDLMGTEVRRTQNPTVSVKVKGNRDNIGSVKVWNPVRKLYAPLVNQSIEEAEGTPLWLHQRAEAFAKAEGLGFRTREERLEVRAYMVRTARSIVPEASAQERRTLAKLGHLPKVHEIIGTHINIERVLASPSGIENAVPFDLAAPNRLDALVEPLRPARGRAAQDERDRRDAGTGKPAPTKADDRRDAGKPRAGTAVRPEKGEWQDFA